MPRRNDLADYWLTHHIAVRVAIRRSAREWRRMRVRKARHGEIVPAFGGSHSPARWVIEPTDRPAPPRVEEPCS